MEYTTITQVFQDITARHKLLLRFYKGEVDENNTSENEDYPATILIPPPATLPILNEQIHQAWSIGFYCVDTFPEDGTDEELDEMLGRMHRVARDTFQEFFDTFKEKTFNGKFIDFTITTIPAMTPIIKDGSNNETGYFVEFAFQEEDALDKCCLDASFADETSINELNQLELDSNGNPITTE